jgi:hypothetical protein
MHARSCPQVASDGPTGRERPKKIFSIWSPSDQKNETAGLRRRVREGRQCDRKCTDNGRRTRRWRGYFSSRACRQSSSTAFDNVRERLTRIDPTNSARAGVARNSLAYVHTCHAVSTGDKCRAAVIAAAPIAARPTDTPGVGRWRTARSSASSRYGIRHATTAAGTLPHAGQSRSPRLTDGSFVDQPGARRSSIFNGGMVHAG